ncbi:hypothetical protein BD779DRAFT_433483 [Infundibulicybe gibba]|nr:hypothetical protein BD779DRAFT_433483 [Infundibulicybe gibba]
MSENPATENSTSDSNPSITEEKAQGPSSPPATPHTRESGDQPPLQETWCSGQPLHYKLPGNGDHWKKCKGKADQFDKDFCTGWIGEIDSLPTFAGLFSAVVTSFTIESYKWLQPSSQDTTNQILLNISAQLGNQNTTISMPPPFSPSASSIRINIFWFLSLIFSLTAGLLAIVCKQWLRRYKRDASLPLPKQDLALRQFQYEGFIGWWAVDIMGALPLLLESGVVFFFIGLIDFLLGLNAEAAIPVIIIIGLASPFSQPRLWRLHFNILSTGPAGDYSSGGTSTPRCLHSDRHSHARCCASWDGSFPQETWTGTL